MNEQDQSSDDLKRLVRLAEKISLGCSNEINRNPMGLDNLLANKILDKKDIAELVNIECNIRSVEVLKGIGMSVAFNMHDGTRRVVGVISENKKRIIKVVEVKDMLKDEIELQQSGSDWEIMIKTEDDISLIITNDKLAMTIPQEFARAMQTKIKKIISGYGIRLLERTKINRNNIYVYEYSGITHNMALICQEILTNAALISPDMPVEIWLSH